MLGLLTWLDLEAAGGTLLQARRLGTALPDIGAEIALGVRGDALVFPPA